MIPSHGLFYHSSSSSDSLIETNVLRQAPAVSQMTTIIGRSYKSYTALEYQYHLGSGVQLWTLPSLAVFRCPLLIPDLIQIDWFTLYDMIRLRRRTSLFQDTSRIQNAFELHRIKEQQQSWVANLAHYSRLPGYLTPEASKHHCQDLLEFLTQDISSGHGTIFTQHEIHIRAAIRVMAEMIFIRPDNYSLIENMDLFTDDRHNQPSAIVAKLQPVIVEQRPQPQTVQQVIFGHNTNSWTAASRIEDGLIRPSAVDPTDLSWLPAVRFYARGVLGVRKVTDRSLTDVLLRAQKYANYGTDGTLCLIGLTVGRQTHATIHQGGVVSEHCANLFCDIVHSQKEKRWALRSHLSRLKMLPCYCHPSCRVVSPYRLATTILGTQV